MTKDDFVCVAAIRGAFGVRGEIRIQSFTEQPESCFDYGPLLDEAGRVILTITARRPLKKGYAVRAKEVVTREDAEGMRGVMLHAPRSALPQPGEDEFYIRDLEGLTAIHVDGREMGVVVRAPDYGAGVLLEIEGKDGVRFLMPFSKQFVPKIDIAEGSITIDPPEEAEDA